MPASPRRKPPAQRAEERSQPPQRPASSPRPATEGEAKRRPAAAKPPVRPTSRPAPRPVVNRPAPAKRVNAPTPRPRPAGTLPPSPTTVPLDHFPALTVEEEQTIAGLGAMQPGSTDGLPSSEVAAQATSDLFAAQVQTDLRASTYLRALSVKGAIFRGMSAIYHGGGATVHSGRARDHVMQHIHGFRL